MSLGERAALEDKAKAVIRDGAEPQRRDVFLSFASEDLQQVNLLRGQAKNDTSELVFNDWSLREPFNSEQAPYIRKGIRERIRQSSVTVVFVSDQAHSSKWVNWEIRESAKLGKAVIAVHSGSAPPSRLPSELVRCVFRST
ncbi:MAG TPA: TIR domain-containing protein [Polyangiaceae bacterium]|nr:TIR domain-containing protein [Polyangiaceae bacterium]